VHKHRDTICATGGPRVARAECSRDFSGVIAGLDPANPSSSEMYVKIDEYAGPAYDV
jgi:hypothetical protein